MEMNTAIVVGVVVALALLAVAIVFLKKRSAHKLRSRFSPEYERVVDETGGIRKAQAQLHQREKRVRGFALKSLTSEQRNRYAHAWVAIQTQFVDDPKAAVIGADQLLGEVMGDRGYPVGDFDQRTADLSVDHPIVVQNYRAAHELADRDATGEASTEDLRQAMLGYRVLFHELVDEPEGDTPVVDEPVLADGLETDEVVPTDSPAVIEPALDAGPVIDERAPADEPTVVDESEPAPASIIS